jgi:hypothetical protein
MSKHILTFTIALLCSMATAVAQNAHDLQDVAFVHTETVYSAQKPNEIIGYAAFYKRSNTQRENDVYGIDLLDTKLVKTHSVKILAPRNAILMGTATNGTAVAISFYNPEKGSYLHKSYDMTLTELGNRTEKVKPLEDEILKIVQKQELAVTAYHFGLRAVPGGRGFVRAGFGEKNGQFKLTCYDNTLKTRWSKDTPDDSPFFESFTLLAVDSQYIAGIALRRKSTFSPRTEQFLTVYETAKGKKALEIELDWPDMKISYSGGFIHTGKGQVALVGAFFDKNDVIGTHKSRGLFVRTFGIADKKVLSTQYFNWATDIANLLPGEEGKRVLENAFYTAHALLPATKGAGGMLVLEQFKKIAAVTEPMVEVLGEKTGGMRIKTGHVLVLELNADGLATSAKVFPQTAQEIVLLPGTDMPSGLFWGQSVKDTRSMGCAFVQPTDQGPIALAADQTGNGNLLLRTITAPVGQGLQFAKSDIAVKADWYQFLPAANGGVVVVAMRGVGRACVFGFL